MNSANDPASASRHARRRVLPLLLCRSTLASPPRILFCLARFPFLFFGMVVAGEVGFLLREKLTEFKCGLGFAKLFSGDLDLAKPRLNFPPAERGLGNECGRVLDSGKKSEKALEYIKSS